MKKFLFIYFILILSIFSANSFSVGFQNVYAENQSITYVAFGDSIAEGYGFNLKTKTDDEPLITGSDESYDFVSNCYADLIRQELEKTHNVSAYNYAYSGDTCQDLLDFIAEFYDVNTKTVKDPTENNATYPSLTNQQVYDSVTNAGTISVCIGANNILGEAFSLIPKFLGIETPTIERTDIENRLKDKILGNTEEGIKGLKSEYSELLETFYLLNPNAYIYFTNVYNPYKVLIADSGFLSLAGLLYPRFTQANLDVLSEVTEVAIAGGTDSQGNAFTGINNVICDSITEFKTNNPDCKFSYVDTKPKFDAKYDSTSTESKLTYNNYVNTQVDKLTTDAVMGKDFDVNKISANYFDPHPTAEGHKLILQAHTDIGILASTPETKPTFDLSVTIADTDVLPNYTLNQGQSLSVFADAANADYTYDYEYTFKNGNIVIKTYQTNPSTINYTDVSNGTYDLYLTMRTNNSGTVYTVCEDKKITTITFKYKKANFSVILDANGGTFTNNSSLSQLNFTILEGECLNAEDYPITNANHTLLGWYNGDEKWNFNTQITSNLTLIARWQENPKLTFDLNGGQGTAPSTIWANDLNGKTITLPTDTKYTKTGFVFVCWNTSQSGGGNDVKNTYNLTTNTTLYAKWASINPTEIDGYQNQTAQDISNVKEVKLRLNIPTGHAVVWQLYHNNSLIENINSIYEYSFTPSQIGEYKVCVTVDGDTSTYYTITVSGQKIIVLTVDTVALEEQLNNYQLVHLEDNISYSANFDTSAGILTVYKFKSDGTPGMADRDRTERRPDPLCHVWAGKGRSGRDRASDKREQRENEICHRYQSLLYLYEAA